MPPLETSAVEAAALPSTDVLIVGGGVCGAALLFVLARYSSLRHVTLVERQARLAQVNSRASSNSQTIHCGDIETNYTLEKALKVQRIAGMISRYASLLPASERERCVFQTQKLVLAVGEAETSKLRERYQRFSPHFPHMRLLEKETIAEWEPRVALVNGALRDEDLLAIGIRGEATAVDYEALSESFVDQARQHFGAEPGRTLDLHLGTELRQITPDGDGFLVDLAPWSGGEGAPGRLAQPQRLRARHVVVNAGAHSLLLAQRMGYGLRYSCLPVAGSFYFAPSVLRGKVYTMQNDKLPFAALHGDPDVRVGAQTRFGPTALLLPLLERYRPASFLDFLRVLRLDGDVLAVLSQLFADPDIRAYILRNLLYEVPGLRRRLFLADVRKIVPDLRVEDLRFAQGYGGVRPQLIDKEQGKLLLGEVSIPACPGLIFNVTPSPGGTCCLGNAVRDARSVVDHLASSLDQARLEQELLVVPPEQDSPRAAEWRPADTSVQPAAVEGPAGPPMEEARGLSVSS
ncbi:MAG: FAD-dependent oxidoreductase [Cyanobacteria bacterium K_Offshore_surface_m2_239]|nr:FAD-dependent oxidoreductase [Cyanobacteria bacterium K_Offshore_surface_m2_239]